MPKIIKVQRKNLVPKTFVSFEHVLISIKHDFCIKIQRAFWIFWLKSILKKRASMWKIIKFWWNCKEKRKWRLKFE